MVLNVHRNHKAYKVRGEGGGGGMAKVGEREIIYLSLQCHHQTDSRVKTGSDETHFNASLFVRDKLGHKTMSTDHNLFEEKGESKRNRAQALQCLPAYTPYH